MCDNFRLSGTVDDWARMNIEKESKNVVEMMKFYAALDSCDEELHKEHVVCPDVLPRAESEGHIDSNHGNVIDQSVFVALWCLCFVLLNHFGYCSTM